jgi:hypothetical protein
MAKGSVLLAIGVDRDFRDLISRKRDKLLGPKMGDATADAGVF